MRTRTKALGALFFGTLMAVLGGCSTQKLPREAAQRLPDTFAGTADTINIAGKGWRDFYADTFLRSLIDTALRKNQDMLKTLQHIEMARAELRFNATNLLPSVAGVASLGQRRFGKYTMDGVGNYDTRFSPNISPEQIIPEHLPDYFLGVQASWEADLWGKLRNRRKAAWLRYLAGIEGRHLVKTSLVYEIAVMYYDLLALDNQLDIINETIELQQNALSVISFQKEAGIANQLAVEQFEAQLFRLRSLGFETRQQITSTEARLNFLCGRFPQEISRNKAGFFDSSRTDISAGIPSQLLRNRPDIRKAENELRASGADLMAARAAFYPSLSISASAGFQAFNPNFLFSPQSLAYNLLGNLVAPLINRNAVRASFRTASARQKEALINYQQSILNGFTEVYTELALIGNLKSIMDLKSSETRVLTASIETSSELFRSGRASYLEVLNAQQNALRARLELVDARKRQYHAWVKVYRALGGGWR